LKFNVPFQHKYSYIIDERSGVETAELSLPSKGRPAIY